MQLVSAPSHMHIQQHGHNPGSGQGCKACPFTDLETLASAHIRATRGMVQERLLNDREFRMEFASPSRDVFVKTASYIAALRKHGCRTPLHEVTCLLATEAEAREKYDRHMTIAQRGYQPSQPVCKGKLIFAFDQFNRPYVR